MSEVGIAFIGIGTAGFFSGIYVGYLFTRDHFRKENYWKANEAKQTLKMYIDYQDKRRLYEMYIDYQDKRRLYEMYIDYQDERRLYDQSHQQ